jgi:large subunit ribosomal protein L9
MKILLVKAVEALGAAGDTVNVADGYARNYLFPKKLAIQYAPGATKMADLYRKNALETEARVMQEAEELASRLKEHVFTITVSADENGHLYGGISEREIVEELKKAGFDIDRRQIELVEHIKNTGEYSIRVKVHGDLLSDITLRVEPGE